MGADRGRGTEDWVTDNLREEGAGGGLGMGATPTVRECALLVPSSWSILFVEQAPSVDRSTIPESAREDLPVHLPVCSDIILLG